MESQGIVVGKDSQPTFVLSGNRGKDTDKLLYGALIHVADSTRSSKEVTEQRNPTDGLTCQSAES